MYYNLEVRKRAVQQIEKSFEFYESRSPALGKRFLATVYKYLEKIKDNPNLFSIKRNSIREAYIKDFPFIIIYEILGETIIIYSIFHTSRNPEKKP